MKKYVIWTLAGLMCMAPAAFAQDPHTQHSQKEPDMATPAGEPTAKKVPGKKMARDKQKKVKPLTRQEQKELEKLKASSENEATTNPVEKSEVK